ncbi:MAG TPA: hypothetical protein VMX17_10665 [Candidatus Glassbacteria bacterium]|nr:hypothetical protein [Candidatus Glassbacteria bacterium]
MNIREKKILFVTGLFLCGLMLSGIPAYLISSQSQPISRDAVFFLLWGLSSIPFGVVLLLWLIQWYKEK